MARLRIGLIGWGTVGSALGRLVAAGPLPLELACLAVRDPAATRSSPLPDGVAVVTPEDVARAGLDAVVELAGGTEEPLGWARTALDAGTPYVTANKALLATHGEELSALARQRGAALLATTTYMLSAMGEGMTYGDALREAQTAGYAEADASLDVDGRDAAQKLAILASEAWGQWRSESQVERHGIRGLEVTEGQVIRLVAEATEQTLAVAPKEVERGSALGATSGIDNLLEIEVRAGGIFRIGGPGAGGRVTAGAVYADLARLASGERPILFGGNA